MSGSIFDTSLYDLAKPVRFAPPPASGFFSDAAAPHAPLKSRKSLPFPLPDPYAEDATFEIYDPRGLFQRRRQGSSALSSTGGSEESESVGSHSRESSVGAGDTRMGRSLGMTGIRGGSSERVPSLSPSLKDEPMAVDSDSPHQPRTPSSPIAIEPHPTSSYPQSSTSSALDTADLLPSPRGRNPLHRLRIGSAGASTAPAFTASMRMSSSPGPVAASRSRESSSEGNNLQPWSPAASFLSSFSPDQGRGFGDGKAGDEEGFGVAGYVLGRELGHGGFGIVREAVRVGDEEHFAVKVVRHAGEPPEQTAGNSLRRSVSQLKAAGTGTGTARRVTISSTSSNPPFLQPLPVPLPTPGPTMARTLSRQMRDLSASLSSLPPPSLPSDSSPPSPSLVQSLLEREISLWQQLAPHPHIMPLLAVHHSSDFSYIFMPLCQGGNLLTYLLNSASSPAKRRGRASIPLAPISPSSPTGSQHPQPRGLPLPTARAIFGQIVAGLHYLHAEAKVTHKDLKLENILCDEPGGTWRIADFGLAETTATARRRPKGGTSHGVAAAAMDDEGEDDPRLRGHFISASDRGPINPALPLASLSRSSSLSHPDPSSSHLHPAGSLPYTPPEQIASPTPILDPSVDVWALGCVLYALVSGALPFADEFEPRLRMKIMKGSWDVPAALQPRDENVGHVRDNVERALVLDVLRHCLETDPTLRWTIDDVRSSEWLSGEKARGRSSRPAGGRRTSSTSSFGAATGSPQRTSTNSRSPSVGGGAVRRKERSTSRGPSQHYAVDPRTRDRERGIVEKDERKMRWERERGDGRSMSRGTGEERLGRAAEPY